MGAIPDPWEGPLAVGGWGVLHLLLVPSGVEVAFWEGAASSVGEEVVGGLIQSLGGSACLFWPPWGEVAETWASWILF